MICTAPLAECRADSPTTLVVHYSKAIVSNDYTTMIPHSITAHVGRPRPPVNSLIPSANHRHCWWLSPRLQEAGVTQRH